jgi:hypothetical protein
MFINRKYYRKTQKNAQRHTQTQSEHAYTYTTTHHTDMNTLTQYPHTYLAAAYDEVGDVVVAVLPKILGLPPTRRRIRDLGQHLLIVGIKQDKQVST